MGQFGQISLGLVPLAEVSYPLAGWPEALMIKGWCRGAAVPLIIEGAAGDEDPKLMAKGVVRSYLCGKPPPGGSQAVAPGARI